MPEPESLPPSDGHVMVKVLGGFALCWQGSVLRIPRPSQRLLAFLALQGRIVKRAAVAGTLWPDASERHASTNLRSALARLQGTARKALAASKLELGLAEGVIIDVRHAAALARRLLDPAVTPDRSEVGMAAVPALSADLLPDWYDDWALIEAEDWHRLRLHALEALAGRRLLRATFNTEILEPKGEPQPNIIQADEPFTVRFRVALEGELWYCICGDWWFDLGFAPTGKGEGFDLSDLLGREKFYIRNWRGCDTRCLELPIYVPPDTIPVRYCGTVYQCAAKVQLFCCGRPAAVVGFDVLGSFQFYKADIADDSQP